MSAPAPVTSTSPSRMGLFTSMLWGIADFQPTWPLKPADTNLPLTLSYSSPYVFFMTLVASRHAMSLTSTS